MSREIKFRAWDKTLKGWIIEPIFFRDGIANILRGSVLASCEDAQVTQFTGLKDKNGKEIYEGDILKLVDGRMIAVTWEITQDDSDRGNWFHVGFCIDGDMDNRTYEVIGNIYENPDLLEHGRT